MALLQQRDGVKPDGKGTPHEEESPLSVLIVDDDQRLLELYQRLMTSWDLPLQVSMAATGMNGLIQAAKKSPNVMIVDPVMHDLDGFEMIRILKKDTDLGSMQIVTVSSLTPDEIDERGGLPRGAIQLQKPVPFARLESILRQKGCADRGWAGRDR